MKAEPSPKSLEKEHQERVSDGTVGLSGVLNRMTVVHI
jgi:hypothetical protein